MRTSNSKTFDARNGKKQLVVDIGDVHYKDNYADTEEQWKDIDLTWEGNRITKAPYELTLEGNKATIRNKRSGEVSTIELLEIGGNAASLSARKNAALDTDLEIVPGYSGVKFTRILKSDRAPLEAKFKVTGDFIVRAKDDDGELPVETTLKDGILTETLKPDREVKYPIRIDPTWQVGASMDDVYRRLTSSSWYPITDRLQAGATQADYYQLGSGMRFTNITISGDNTIISAYLSLTAEQTNSNAGCNTRISAEDVDDAPTFVDDRDVFDARWANRDLLTQIDWDNIGSWSNNVEYYLGGGHGSADPPEIKTIIQARIDSPTWISGYDIVIFWEDFADRSTHTPGGRRPAQSWEKSPSNAPKLIITYGVFNYELTGVTKNKGGGTLANCECFLCKDNLDDTASFIAHTQSDGSGNYVFAGLLADTDPQFFVISWKDAVPHVFDVTDHVLQLVEEQGTWPR